MGAHAGAVDHRVFGVGVFGQVLEHTLPDAGLGPAAMAAVDVLPVAEPLGQVAPGNPRPVAIQHRLDEQPVVCRRHPHMARVAGQQGGTRSHWSSRRP